jgi:uncharacterized damage-inducible protein DinB
MNTREFFAKQFKSERPKFVSVLRAMPAGQLDYRSHERNSTAGQIAWFLVLELRTLVETLSTGEHHWEQPPAPETPEAIVEEYEKAAQALEDALATADDEQWESDGKLYFGDKLMMNRARGEILWDFLHDAIHHRGQLSVYLRPMGGKVPSIYGPSGDSKS